MDRENCSEGCLGVLGNMENRKWEDLNCGPPKICNMLITSIIIKLQSATKFKYAQLARGTCNRGRTGGQFVYAIPYGIHTRTTCSVCARVFGMDLRCLPRRLWGYGGYGEKQAFRKQSQWKTCQKTALSPPHPSRQQTLTGSACKLMRHLFIMAWNSRGEGREVGVAARGNWF